LIKDRVQEDLESKLKLKGLFAMAISNKRRLGALWGFEVVCKLFLF
jgi:hypothetical protein